MIWLERFYFHGVEASPHNPFLSRKVQRPLSDWRHDGQPTPATLVNGHPVTLIRLDWSDENYPVRLFVADNGLSYRLADFTQIGNSAF